ncbi:hypothetical protein HOY82DRAFT_544661 [Tuber indicum]|nr:hypothetical protein HOY82DRAFT_544661 [Tuber indicum]
MRNPQRSIDTSDIVNNPFPVIAYFSSQWYDIVSCISLSLTWMISPNPSGGIGSAVSGCYGVCSIWYLCFIPTPVRGS